MPEKFDLIDKFDFIVIRLNNKQREVRGENLGEG